MLTAQIKDLSVCTFFISNPLYENFFGDYKNIYVLVPIILFMTPTSFFSLFSVDVHLLSELIH